MAKRMKTLKSISRSEVRMFKIKNRRGYAAICGGNLTEGTTTALALNRMNKALRRMGCTLG